MLRFNCLGFPVTVHWTFWLMAAFLSGALHVQGQDAWGRVLLYVAVTFVSILVHELGHALYQRKFGGRQPLIHLYAMGGYARTEGRFTRKESLIISAMGPAFTAMLAVVGWFWLKSLTGGDPAFAKLYYQPTFGGKIAAFLWFLNPILLVLNLLPVYPFDGGRILEHAMDGRQPILRYRIAMGVSAVVAVLALGIWGQPFLGLLFGYMAYENYKRSIGEPVRGLFGG